MILAGDIGGTNARLALFEKDGRTRVRSEFFPSASFPTLEAVVRAFLGSAPPKIDAATFGLAGPVVDNRASVTNLPWTVDAGALGRALGIPRVALINDLVAVAYGAHSLPANRLRVLSGGGPPQPRGGNIAVISAGTGLGEAALVWDGARHVPCPTEGGHTDFAPRTRLEFELFEFLQARYGAHVSWERVVAGPGLGALYDFFVQAKGIAEAPEIAARVAAAPDRNREIAELGAAAIRGRSRGAAASPACARALEAFIALYGAEAGNLALKTFATGGVYVCGAIAASFADVFAEAGFVDAFVAKGRFADFMQRVPLAIALDVDIGLSGSAQHAALTSPWVAP